MKKLWDLKKGFSNLELEGQWHGIIMGVTCLLLLGQFYTIQTQTDQTFWRGVYIYIYHLSAYLKIKVGMCIFWKTALGTVFIFKYGKWEKKYNVITPLLHKKCILMLIMTLYWMLYVRVSIWSLTNFGILSELVGGPVIFSSTFK